MESRFVYGISPLRRAILYGTWAIVALPLLILWLVTGEAALGLTSITVSAVLLPIFLWIDRAAKLILTPKGIEARQAGAVLKTSWTNVAAFRLIPGSEGFILREPMSGRGPERFASASNVRLRGAS